MTNAAGYALSSTAQAFYEAGEAMARKMADDNDCEGAWFLRGVLDRLTFGAPDAGRGNVYASHYLRGWTSIDSPLPPV